MKEIGGVSLQNPEIARELNSLIRLHESNEQLLEKFKFGFGKKRKNKYGRQITIKGAENNAMPDKIMKKPHRMMMLHSTGQDDAHSLISEELTDSDGEKSRSLSPNVLAGGAMNEKGKS